ncbi:MAG TPA: hypothetical protein VGJ58_11025 [Gaiellaceae bacterium]
MAGLPKGPPWSALVHYRSSRRASRAGQYWYKREMAAGTGLMTSSRALLCHKGLSRRRRHRYNSAVVGPTIY